MASRGDNGVALSKCSKESFRSFFCVAKRLEAAFCLGYGQNLRASCSKTFKWALTRHFLRPRHGGSSLRESSTLHGQLATMAYTPTSHRNDAGCRLIALASFFARVQKSFSEKYFTFAAEPPYHSATVRTPSSTLKVTFPSSGWSLHRPQESSIFARHMTCGTFTLH